jgi:endonuclease/exonuclease/phosphatase family metal-dependent hydrolase
METAMPRLTLALALILAATAAPAETALRVMSFNIWGGGQNEGKDVTDTVAAIRAAGADIVGVQETRLEGPDCTAEACPPGGVSVAQALADALGFHVVEQEGANDALWSNAILSRHPIGALTENALGAPVTLPDGRVVWIFNIHLDDAPYQPYQLAGIEYGDAPFITTGAEAEDWARRTRGAAMDLLFADLAAAEGAAAVFVTGDFNEPSALDWTEAVAAAGRQPVAVDWPASRRLLDAGFVDGYRMVHADPLAKPAFTWTSMGDEADPEDRHDRIDLVFARGAGLAVTDAAIVGEDGPRSDIVSMPWPSDHRAVVVDVRF